MSAAQVLEVRTGRLRHPQPVEREQGDQRMLGGRRAAGGDKECAKLSSRSSAVACDS